MNNRTLRNDGINTARMMYKSLLMILLGLLVAWGVELLMKELFLLG